MRGAEFLLQTDDKHGTKACKAVGNTPAAMSVIRSHHNESSLESSADAKQRNGDELLPGTIVRQT